MNYITHTFYKNGSKWIIDLKIKHKTIKPLEDTIGGNLDSLEHSDDFFLDTTPKAQFMKEKIDKLDLIKVKKVLPYKRQCQENKKTSHKLEENIYKRHI